ncbi:MAG: restriction endonuclease subunit S [Oscillospiraceae bacterium]
MDSYSKTLNGLGYSVSKEFPKGSICMTIAANVGDVAILNFNACFPDSVVGFVPTSKVYWNYLYYTLSAMKQQLTRNAIISTQLNLIY